MINDYSEVTAVLNRQITDLEDTLERKQWEESQKLISILRIEFNLLDEFVEKKLRGEK